MSCHGFEYPQDENETDTCGDRERTREAIDAGDRVPEPRERQLDGHYGEGGGGKRSPAPDDEGEREGSRRCPTVTSLPRRRRDHEPPELASAAPVAVRAAEDRPRRVAGRRARRLPVAAATAMKPIHGRGHARAAQARAGIETRERVSGTDVTRASADEVTVMTADPAMYA